MSLPGPAPQEAGAWGVWSGRGKGELAHMCAAGDCPVLCSHSPRCPPLCPETAHGRGESSWPLLTAGVERSSLFFPSRACPQPVHAPGLPNSTSRVLVSPLWRAAPAPEVLSASCRSSCGQPLQRVEMGPGPQPECAGRLRVHMACPAGPVCPR